MRSDEEAIRQLMARYARAIDRRDATLLGSVYWPEAVDHHPGFSGTRDLFVAYIMQRLQVWDCTTHNLGQSWIEIDDTKATAETYFLAHHIRENASERVADVVCGRYQDQLEKRGTEWRVLLRVVAIVWTDVRPLHSMPIKSDDDSLKHAE
jgi:hypothetical protein